MQYDVFISYSRKDSEIAKLICETFEEVGINCFIDLQEISGGFEFPTVLAEAIINSRVFLYLASINSYNSRFTQNEITFAFNEKPKESILPYIIDGSTMPPTMRFVFSNINWRRIEEHPIDTVLVDDILHLLGKKRQSLSSDKTIPPTSLFKIVDLGLSVCWADRNIGASSPEEYGEHFAWGEIETKDEYAKDNYKHLIDERGIPCIGNNISGTEHDVANQRLGDTWRLPTKREMEELVKKCTWKRTIQNGVSGYKVIGTNGNYIFLPAAGYHRGERYKNSGASGYYRTGTLSTYDQCSSYNLYFNNSEFWVACASCFCGNTVRPVTDKT